MDRYSRPDVLLGDTTEYRASSYGGCPMALAYTALAHTNEIDERPEKPGPWLQNAWDESSALEQQAFDLWWDDQSANIELLDDPITCEYHIGSDRTITGTVDFLVSINGQKHVIEIKVVGDTLFEQLEKVADEPWSKLSTGTLPRKYRTQCGVYAAAYEWPVVLVVCKKNKGALTGDYHARTYDHRSNRLPSHNDLARISVDISEHIQSIRDGNRVCDVTGNCPWTEHCHPVETVDEEVDVLVRQLNLLQLESKELDERIAALKADLSSITQFAGGRVVTPSGHKLTWVEQHVDERVVKAHDRNYLKVTYNKKGQV
jgi:hypothetical protein